MRNFIQIINEAMVDQSSSGVRHLRIYRQMLKLRDARIGSTDDASRLLADLNYLKDAIREFGARQGGEMQQKMHLVLNHFEMFVPRDGDIEAVMANPADVHQEILDGLKFLHMQLPREGVLIEGEETLNEIFGMSAKEKAAKAGAAKQAEIAQSLKGMHDAREVDKLCYQVVGKYQHYGFEIENEAVQFLNKCLGLQHRVQEVAGNYGTWTVKWYSGESDQYHTVWGAAFRSGTQRAFTHDNQIHNNEHRIRGAVAVWGASHPNGYRATVNLLRK